MQPLAASVGSDIVLPCDVTDEASLDAAFATLGERWGSLDFLVHAIGFSDKNELRGSYTENTTAANFTPDHADLGLFLHRRRPARREADAATAASLLTLTYYGAEKVMPHYNVMGVAKAALEASVKYMAMDLGPRGIRVNALSAGPIKTLAAPRHRRLPLHHEVERAERAAAPQRHPGRRRQVARSTCSPTSPPGVTGENHHVDAGYHVVGMKAEDAPDIDVVSGRKEAAPVTAAAFLSIALIHLMAAISPGPAFVMTVRTAASDGFRAGARLAVGLGLGGAIWALAALFGLALLFELAPALPDGAQARRRRLPASGSPSATWRHAGAAAAEAVDRRRGPRLPVRRSASGS